MVVDVLVVVTSPTLFPLRDRIVGSREREDARDRFEHSDPRCSHLARASTTFILLEHHQQRTSLVPFGISSRSN